MQVKSHNNLRVILKIWIYSKIISNIICELFVHALFEIYHECEHN